MAQLVREYHSDLGQLAAMRAFILAECRRAWAAQPNDTALSELQLAVQEAATNIVRHGYQDDSGAPIRLTLDTDPDQVCLVFTYTGRAFRADKVPPPIFDGSRTGGFGVYLIQQLVDEVEYGCTPSGQCYVRLRKQRTSYTRE